KLGQTAEAGRLLQETRRLDRLDWWARRLGHEKLACDLQTQLDIAHDYSHAGFYAEAIELLTSAAQASSPAVLPLPTPNLGALPLLHYTLGRLEEKRGSDKLASKHFQHAAAQSPDYCFPSRLEEIAILEAAMRANPRDPRAPYYLGNLLYDRRRHEEA